MSAGADQSDSGQIILDASALLALLKEEPGGAKVADMLAAARISAVNFAEVVSHFIHFGMPAHEVDSMLNPLPVTIVDVDLELARIAGRLRAVTAEGRPFSWRPFLYGSGIAR